jgi:hypothetical protein
MDDIVVRGMARWPNVPSVYGWLSLDRRGNWLIKGERIANSLVTEFIGRNYARDERGCWYFQNGPQRVFLDLDYAPWVYRMVSPQGTPLAIESHSGQRVTKLAGAWLDESGTMLLETEHGIGTVHDRDLDLVLPHLADGNGNPLTEDQLEALMERAQRGNEVPLWLIFREGRVKINAIASREIPGRFGFIARPQPPAGEEVCI